MVVGRIRVLTGQELEAALSSLPSGSLRVAETLHTEKATRRNISRKEVSVFCNLITEMTSELYSLEAIQ